jgi:hypothetical protein
MSFVPHDLSLGYRSPVPLLKFRVAPVLGFKISSGSKKKELRCACMSEAKASHAHKMWTEVSSPGLLGMSVKGLLLKVKIAPYF